MAAEDAVHIATVRTDAGTLEGRRRARSASFSAFRSRPTPSVRYVSPHPVSSLDLSGQLFSGSFHAACCRFRYSL